MVKWALVLVLWAGTTLSAGAQEQDARVDLIVADLIPVMKQALKLTEAQTVAARSIYKQYFLEAKSIATAKLSPDSQKIRLQSAKRDMEAQLRNYLSEDQFAQWNAMINQRSQKAAPAKSPAGGSNALADAFRKDLDQKGAPPAGDGVLQSGAASSSKGGVF